MENASEEEESEDVESEEEERQQQAEGPAKEASRTYEPISQVGTSKLFFSIHIVPTSHGGIFYLMCKVLNLKPFNGSIVEGSCVELSCWQRKLVKNEGLGQYQC